MVEGGRPLSLAPGGEGVVERALAGLTFLDRDDGVMLVGVDHRQVEPGALLQKLDIA